MKHYKLFGVETTLSEIPSTYISSDRANRILSNFGFTQEEIENEIGILQNCSIKLTALVDFIISNGYDLICVTEERNYRVYWHFVSSENNELKQK